MDEFKDQVKKSFQACKTDIASLNEQNEILKENFEKSQEENRELRSKVEDLIVQVKGLTIAIEYIKDIKVNSVQPKEVSVEPQIPIATTTPIPAEIKKEPKSEKDPYEALLEFKAKINKRDLLKQKLMSLISENGMNLAELKFMFVEHFKYCSKATFYNYLKELELERMVRIERENSRNIIYPSSVRKEV